MLKFYPLKAACLILLLLSCVPKSEQTHSSEIVNDGSDTLFFSSVRNYIILESIIQDSVKARLIFDTNAGLALYLDSTFIETNNWLKDKDIDVVESKKTSGRVRFIREMIALENRDIEFKIGKISHTLKNTGIFNFKKVIGEVADGIVGNDFMSKYIVEIDYLKSQIILHKPEKYVNPNSYANVPISFNSAKHLLVDVTYNLANGRKFTEKSKLDLGNGGSAITINDAYLLKEYNLLHETQSVKAEENTMSLLGEHKTVTGRLGSIELGSIIKIDTPKVNILFSDNPPINPKRGNGMALIGNYIFLKFGKLVIDYPNKQIYLPTSLVD